MKKKKKHLDELLNELLIKMHQIKNKKKDSNQDDNKDVDMNQNEQNTL
ncbi:MAG TPA: hypothetical protein PLL09_04645 [Flavobacterium sp.]|nr:MULTISPECIES: hypothetical protein [unclassified Flavobacterium]HRE77097.1 hypothetical protein [Flavobacterium sp.]